MSKAFYTGGTIMLLAVLALMALFGLDGCTETKTIIYANYNETVVLVSPPSSTNGFEEIPTLIWEPVIGAAGYQVQLSRDAAFSQIVFTQSIADTSYAHTSGVINGIYYWRVRVKNNDNIWSDWSDAAVWSFTVNDNSLFISLASVLLTPGVAQDVLVEDNLAYVADGHATLTIVDVTDHQAPSIHGMIDRLDADFAQGLWKMEGDSMMFIADTDGKIFAADLSYPYDPYSPRTIILGWEQNLQALVGMPSANRDTIWLFTILSGFNKREMDTDYVIYEAGIPRFGDSNIHTRTFFNSDPDGVAFDSFSVVVEYGREDSTYYDTQMGYFVFVAVTDAGLWWYNVSNSHDFDGNDTSLVAEPKYLGRCDTPSSALKVFAIDGFAYVADDRGGLQIFDLPDTIPAWDHSDTTYHADPVLVADINTSGRAKDVHVVGNDCYLADGSGGLKLIDVSDPYNPSFLAAFSTPYAYGVFADEGFAYIADRDNGLMIFERK